MKDRILVLLILSPVIYIWLYVVASMLYSIQSLLRILAGIIMVSSVYFLHRKYRIGYIQLLIILFIISIIVAKIVTSVPLDAFFLFIPLFYIIIAYEHRGIITLLLAQTIMYLYVLLEAYGVDIGLSYRSGLMVFMVFFDLLKLALTGHVSSIAFYEPLPGTLALYALSTLMLVYYMARKNVDVIGVSRRTSITHPLTMYLVSLTIIVSSILIPVMVLRIHLLAIAVVSLVVLIAYYIVYRRVFS